METLTHREQQEIDSANSTGKPPVVFAHGLWLLSGSWNPWRALFEANGYATLAPGWPDEPETVEQAREHPEALAQKRIKQVTDHYLHIIRQLKTKPAVVGHSLGGLIAERIAGEGESAVTVAIDPAPFRGILAVPLSALKAASGVLSNPLNYTRAVPLSLKQFRFAFANVVDQSEAQELYEKYAVPGSGVAVYQIALANLNPWTEARADTGNPARGPLLVISGEHDNTVPWSIAQAAYKLQKRNSCATEIRKMPDRGHSLTIDRGWHEVAQVALEFVGQHLPEG